MPNADRHLITGRIAIGEDEHHHRPAVLGADLGHGGEQGVADLAGGQIEIGVILIGERLEHLAQARLLAIEDEAIALLRREVRQDDGRAQGRPRRADR